MRKIIPLIICSLLFLSCEDKKEEPLPLDCAGVEGGTEVVDCTGECGGTAISDIDGNCYETMQIGEQIWITENLRVTHYNDGSELPTGYNDSDWINLSTGAYAVFPADDNNLSQDTCGDNCAEVYGNLYNWFAVNDDRGICPEGWHVPTDGEYTVLSNYLGGEYVAGGKMKEIGTEHWCGYYPNYPDNCINESATNESGFTALPAGSRHVSYGDYSGLGRECYFWTSDTEDIGVGGYGSYRRLEFDESRLVMGGSSFRFGFSVRCIKD